MLDLRKPIAYFFLINSIILIAYGLVAPHPVPFRGQDINLNVIWGVVMLAFGAGMLALALCCPEQPHHHSVPEDERS